MKAKQAPRRSPRSAEQRVADLQQRMLDQMEKHLSPVAAQRRDEFRKKVEEELRNGGRLILRPRLK